MKWKRVTDFISRDHSVPITYVGILVPTLIVFVVALEVLFGR